MNPLVADQLSLLKPEIPQVRLADYDVILVNSSAGKDSLLMLLKVAGQARDEGVLDRVTVVHATLGEFEWNGTLDLAKRQAHAAGVARFEVVERDGDDLLGYTRRRGMFPSPGQRWCTSDFKRAPVSRLITRLVNEVYERQPDRARLPQVLNCLGMRAKESTARGLLKPLIRDKRLSNGRREVVRWLPVHHLTDAEVWEEIRKIRSGGSPFSGLVHPAYSHGQSRASCVFCIFHTRPELIRAAASTPENAALAQRYELVERQTGHRFRQNVSMAEVLQAAGIPALEVERAVPA